MASILSKLRLITLSNFQDVLDWVIDLNDLGAVKQYARDLEDSIRQMESFGNSLTGGISTLKREIGVGEKATVDLQADVDAFLEDDDPSNDNQALPIQVTLDDATATLESNRGKLTDKLAKSQKVEHAISMMTAKLTAMVRRVKELEEMKKETAALVQGADAYQNMESAMGDIPSVDKVGARIVAKHATAEAGFDRVMGAATEAMESDSTVASASAAIIRRKAELKAKKEAEA